MNKETAEAYALGAIGAIGGAYKYYIRPELTAGRAWAGLLVGITAYELACPEGQTLSEGVDRGLERHPYLIPTAIGYTALHLANALPPQIDMFHQFTNLMKGER